MRHSLASRIVRYAQRRKVQLGKDEITGALNRFGSFRSSVLLVHSSLSACGQIFGGAPTVIRALCEWVGGKTLIMPVHSYSYPTRIHEMPVFSVDVAPSRVGAITEKFRNYPGVKRSYHPSHSIAASGPLSEEICQDHHSCGTPCGAGTPYAKLVVGECAVLFFGTTLDAYTLFHTAEDAAAVPYLYEARPYNWSLSSGSAMRGPWVTQRHDMRVPRRFRAMDNWFENRGLLDRMPLGRGELLLVRSAAQAHVSLVAALKQDPFFFVDRRRAVHAVWAPPRHLR